MIIDNQSKTAPPPPPYSRSSRSQRAPPPPFVLPRRDLTIQDLPQHVVLQIVQSMCDENLPVDDYRRVLYWLETRLRSVSKVWYTACMHVLRSFYLPYYVSQIRAPYTSNPFPLASSGASTSGASTSSAAADTPQRETAIFDMFIAFKVRQDMLRDESELNLDAGSEGLKDLFELMQPRARMEDLVRKYMLRAGLTTLSSPANMSGRSDYSFGSDAIPFAQISVSFTPRKVGLVRTVSGRRRTLVEVARERNESLESVAKRLVRELVNVMNVIQ